MDYGLGGLGILIIGFFALLAILWFLLPFAIFGTKDLLQTLINESIKTRESIDKLAELLKKDGNAN